MWTSKQEIEQSDNERSVDGSESSKTGKKKNKQNLPTGLGVRLAVSDWTLIVHSCLTLGNWLNT